ncbi:hypothetical protein HFP15_39850 [Amycolatopsis sp. K13G38]|uniref:Uncharacterized protein n=1 Tax=Amycolatopsis acididurans TaxID=2724524 RepID=A0ABX1JI24_9PSEU|nr:hypothetical protein [Amycolatopsis acididurans]NKQ59014.1 hypothetical protein [Amycolatopsis acididurans]
MPTAEEIQRRVEQNDAARSMQRAAAAKRVGELVQRRTTIAEELATVDRELHDVMVEAQKVITIDELAQFTDTAATDLTHWATACKPARAKRKRPDARRKTPPTSTSSVAAEPASRVPAEV